MSSNETSVPRTFPEIYRRLKKRQQPLVLNGLDTSYEDKNNDCLCPICFEIIEEAHITKCGHTFCFKCIGKNLDQNNRCPKCNFVIDKKDIFPNFIVNELATKQKEKRLSLIKTIGSDNSPNDLRDFMIKESDNLDLHDVKYLLDVLAQKKYQLEAECQSSHLQLMKEFLNKVSHHKKEQLQRLSHELSIIEQDTNYVDSSLKKNEMYIAECSNSHPIKDTPNSWPLNSNESTPQDGFNGSQHCKRKVCYDSSLSSRRKRMYLQFDDLKQCYFDSRAKELQPTFSGNVSPTGIEDFKETMANFIKYNGFRPLATLSYASDLFDNTSIVSSIEFDKDNEYFAIAGVTKKIKVFDYAIVIKDSVDIHYPIMEMVCNSKISSISWSSYHKGMLASSDYEGTVTIWDAYTGQKSNTFQEHEKRCWSVDFNKVDTKLLASGSDDAKVKLWSTTQEHSISSLEAKANVCCVKFCPDSVYNLTFGSADHCVHYYDLRNTKQALGIFRGHKKAVSYVKFLNSKEIVSASTDSQLKLWNVNQPNCVRSFNGHINEKNFVGLSTDGNYIACGSENNALYVYYKGLSKQLLTYKFDTVRNILERDRKEEDANEFVSAVCWRTGSNVVVAANSQGTIKVLELV